MKSKPLKKKLEFCISPKSNLGKQLAGKILKISVTSQFTIVWEIIETYEGYQQYLPS